MEHFNAIKTVMSEYDEYTQTVVNFLKLKSMLHLDFLVDSTLPVICCSFVLFNMILFCPYLLLNCCICSYPLYVLKKHNLTTPVYNFYVLHSFIGLTTHYIYNTFFCMLLFVIYYLLCIQDFQNSVFFYNTLLKYINISYKRQYKSSVVVENKEIKPVFQSNNDKTYDDIETTMNSDVLKLD